MIFDITLSVTNNMSHLTKLLVVFLKMIFVITLSVTTNLIMN
jgi:hypothetical protein